MDGRVFERKIAMSCPNASCVALVVSAVPCCGPCLDETRAAEQDGRPSRRLAAPLHSAKCRENQRRRGAVL
jgi:hypothetical protein